MILINLCACFCAMLVLGIISSGSAFADSPGTELVVMPYSDRAIIRVGRTEKICLRVENPVDSQPAINAQIIVPNWIKVKSEATRQSSTWSRKPVYANTVTNYFVYRKIYEKRLNTTLCWEIQAEKCLAGEIKFMVSSDDGRTVAVALPVQFLPALKPVKAAYVPKPVPAKSKYIIGAMYYSGWKPGQGSGWSLLEPYPDRKPALGYYDESNPEIIDWEIKQAVEHGIGFFNYCWYREYGNQGKPVKTWLDHQLREGLFKSRYANLIKFAIQWSNMDVISDQAMDDWKSNIVPFWIDTYFKHPSYLLVDGKPVLFLYEIDKLINKFGGEDKLKAALDWAKEECRNAGFSGLMIIDEYRGIDPAVLRKQSRSGLDASFAYCYNPSVPSSNDESVKMAMSNLRSRVDENAIPIIPTLSVGWEPRPWVEYIEYPWATTQWHVGPAYYKKFAIEIKQLMDSRPSDNIGARMLLLDNWNEWGEGHFIAPCRRNGYWYLDVIRSVFTDSPKSHTDLLPEEVGLGPYEKPYRDWLSSMETVFGK